MLKFLTYLVGAAFCLTHRAYSQTTPFDETITQTMNQIKPEALAAHVNYLADDRLQGRLPGTVGYQLAVDYAVAQLRASGIEPGGERGTYLQRVRLRQAVVKPAATLAFVGKEGGEEKLRPDEYTLYPHFEQPAVTVAAPLVFAGAGISAPELGYDDYAGLEVKGKIVVIRRGAPAQFPPSVAASSMNLTTILKTALNHGAVGVLIAAPVRKVRGVNGVRFPDGKIAAAGSYVAAPIKLVGLISRARLNQLLHRAGLDSMATFTALKAGKPASATLPVSVKAAYKNTYRDFDSYNVIGKITGSDAALKNEYVIHTAHLDHLGIGTPVKNDSIYNGAHDNASGVACLLEIAKAYGALRVKPKRSILIALVTGEEMGLLGSAYLAVRPVVPAKSIVANINTDMPTIIAPLLAVVALGAEHSSLLNQVQTAAGYLGLTVEADPEPEQNRFVRSDQYSFVKQGIPALHLKYGNKTADGTNNLSQTVQQWRATYYHQPQDNPDGIFDYNAGRTYAQLNFLISYLVAQNPARPTWNPGGFFAKPPDAAK